MYGYIYKTTNLLNGKIYVGQHCSVAFDTKYYGSGFILKQALSKYGKDNFSCEVLEWCETKQQLEEREIFWIDKLKSCDKNIGYNVSYGGFTPRFKGVNHPMYGKHHTEEAKEKNRIAKLGKKQTQETKDKRTKILRQINDRKQQEKIEKWVKEKHKCEFCGKIMPVKYASGRFCSFDCVKYYLRKIHTGRKASEETIKKLKESHTGQIGNWTGKHRDLETRKKISEKLSNKPRLNRRIVYKIENNVFYGLDSGAEHYGVTKSCMSLWIKQGFTSNKLPITIIVDNQLHRTK